MTVTFAVRVLPTAGVPVIDRLAMAIEATSGLVVEAEWTVTAVESPPTRTPLLPVTATAK